VQFHGSIRYILYYLCHDLFLEMDYQLSSPEHIGWLNTVYECTGILLKSPIEKTFIRKFSSLYLGYVR